ncbi:LysR family transcriptional regulator [Pararhodospirillum oryzae]|uniref:LysR family transcriptional regulator n=1 Tax=Pararhodospirillum oryzae TaxID=478448 RepID=A0A512HC22_9PROT|nr:LysR family transcriptional regulator [Pararhodospirillum oryzae]GEO83001.1 LysR family transcriptional regulator [Pararhodospirillum oryzae]
MELKALRVFVEVVRQGGFSKAAKVLFSTQSTVSKAIRQLEDETGVPLLDRIGHGSTLTAAGEIVYRRALRLLAERDDLKAELADLRGLRRGVLRLGLPPIGASSLYAPVLALYRQHYPGIEIRLVEHGSDRLMEILQAGEIDFAGLLLPIAGEFEWQAVRREPLLALLRDDHPLARRPVVTLKDLEHTPFILFGSGFALNRILLDACQRRGVTPNVVIRSIQIDFIAELAGAGLGVAFLPRMIAHQLAHPPIRLIALDEPETDWNMAMAWRRSAYLPPAAEAWLALLRAVHGG